MSAFLSVITNARMEKAQCMKQKKHVQSEQRQVQRELHSPSMLKMMHNIQCGNNLSSADLSKLGIETTEWRDSGEPLPGFEEFGNAQECVEKDQATLQKEAEIKLNEMISDLQMEDAVDQSEIDALDLEITACDEQIKEAKQQAQEATREMYGSGK